MRVLWITVLLFLMTLGQPYVSWGQDKPAIELPDVVIVGQEVNEVQQEKLPLAPSTLPLGLQSALEAGKVPNLAPPESTGIEGPIAENPGCLLFSGMGGNRDEALYKRALKQYNQGDDDKARELFARLEKSYPKSPYRGAALFWLGESYYRNGDAVSALAAYEQVITTYGREPLRDYALYRAADLSLQRQDYEKAARYAMSLRSQYPASPTAEYAHYLIGEAAFRRGRFAEAEQEIATFLQRYPDSALHERALLLDAEALYEMHRYPQANAAYRAFLTRYRDSQLVRQAYYGLAWTQLKQGEERQAQRRFQTLRERYGEPHYAEAAQYATFVAALRQGDERQARSALQQLQRDFPQSALLATARSELAWKRFEARAYDEALILYRELAQDPKTPPASRDVAQYMIGESLYQLDHYRPAAVAFRNIRSDADSTLQEKAAFRLGLALYYRQAYAQASQVLQAFIARYAASTYRDEAVFWLAETQFQQGDYTGALQTSQRLTPNSRLYDYVLYDRGWSRLRLQQWQRALETFQQVVDDYPNSAVRADAIYRVAEVFRRLDDEAQAQAWFERYLEAYPQGSLAAQAQLQLAELNGGGADIEARIAALRAVQQQFPGTPSAIDAQYRLGMLLFGHDRFAEARDVFQTFANAYPDHARTPTAQLRLADTYYNEKQFRQALIAYHKVALLYPQSPLAADARYGIVLTHYQTANYPQFLREGQDFARQYPAYPLTQSLLLQMAEYYQTHQQPQPALDTYTYMTEHYADSLLVDKARFRLGELYQSTGDTQAAIAAFEQLLRQGHDEGLKPDALLAQAEAYESVDTTKALQRYDRLAKSYPKSPLAGRALYEAGQLLRTERAYDQASQRFEAMMSRYPNDPLHDDSLLALGITLLDMDEPKRAIDVLQQARQSTTPHTAAQAQWQLGRAHSADGALQQGINAYLRVAYLYPGEKGLVAEALRQAAHNYVALGKCSEALTVYDKLRQQTISADQQQAIEQEIAGSGCRP